MTSKQVRARVFTFLLLFAATVVLYECKKEEPVQPQPEATQASDEPQAAAIPQAPATGFVYEQGANLGHAEIMILHDTKTDHRWMVVTNSAGGVAIQDVTR